MKSLLITDLHALQDDGKLVCVKGWLKTRRDSKGGFSFLEINDGSCLQNLQVVADNTLNNYQKEICNLYPGAALEVRGRLVKSQGPKQATEVRAESVSIFGFCDVKKYPLQKQRISFEKLRESTHLRGRTNTFGAIVRVRNAISMATHEFFQERNFYYLHTPIITTNDCEGAGQIFRVTTLDYQKSQDAEQGKNIFEDDFFGQEASLTVSGQLEAESYASAVGRVYTFGPTFRAENSNTSRHLAEFWMVEPEMAFADLADDVKLAESYLKFVFAYVMENCFDDMAFFNTRIDTSLLSRLHSIVESKFCVILYSEAIELLSKNPNEFEFPVKYGMDLQSEHERFLAEKAIGKPVILTNFPKKIKPFYMRLNEDTETVAAMDVLLPSIGEIIGGSQREERLDVLTQRMDELNLDKNSYWWYLDLRKFGTVPHSGFGAGFERLVQFCTGMKNIRDVIPFPRTPKNAKI